MIIWPFQIKQLEEPFDGALIILPFGKLIVNANRINAKPLIVFGKMFMSLSELFNLK